MEKPEEKKQNNRKEDEKRNPDSERNMPSKEKEWDPNRDIESDVTDEEKIKHLKGVKLPKTSNTNEK
ncbi:hypothetical protein [Gelidibacter pelagius]|uniref:Uncharacterized protein n=1 Tax=Gelidibacter pelagius TaxID=2819985 RepID=A0ABS3SSA1_9FLAO|nr:hypothetical protein [Gelidibacter pelagius]MBO3098593.1 hypothetical protein [Gelidibacter pelagius]